MVVKPDGSRQLLAAKSRTLKPAEKNYSTYEKECLAIVYGVDCFRPYLYGRKFRLITDHAGLTFIMTKRDLEKTGRVARWIIKLMDMDFEVVYNPGATHSDADYLSRPPFPEEGLLSCKQMDVYESFDIKNWNYGNTERAQRADPILRVIIDAFESDNPTSE